MAMRELVHGNGFQLHKIEPACATAAQEGTTAEYTFLVAAAVE